MGLEDERLDRSKLSVGTFDDDDARHYWLSRTPDERLAALEFLRQIVYGYDPISARMERTIEVLDLHRT